MKYIIFFQLLLSFGFCNAQNNVIELPHSVPQNTSIGTGHAIIGEYVSQFQERPCGTWVAQPQKISNWETVDTLGNKLVKGSPKWIYDDEKSVMNEDIADAFYTPCGRGEADVYIQYRIDVNSGIRQKRTRIISYKYVERQKTPYEKVVDSLNAKNK